MILWRLPFQRWPWYCHALAALSLVAVVAAAAGWRWHSSQAALLLLQAERQLLQNQWDAAQSVVPPAVRSDFTQSLPKAASADDVVRDIGRMAQSEGVQVSALGVEPRAASVSQLGKIRFNLTAMADYRATKAWLGELLGRYPSLGVQSLSMRALPNDAMRQDVRVSLVFFVKD